MGERTGIEPVITVTRQPDSGQVMSTGRLLQEQPRLCLRRVLSKLLVQGPGFEPEPSVFKTDKHYTAARIAGKGLHNVRKCCQLHHPCKTPDKLIASGSSCSEDNRQPSARHISSTKKMRASPWKFSLVQRPGFEPRTSPSAWVTVLTAARVTGRGLQDGVTRASHYTISGSWPSLRPVV